MFDLNGLCGCGRRVRYSHFKDGEEVMSCNKYAVCLTYEELEAKMGVYCDSLVSISKNTCCDSCQEAALVAKQALNVKPIIKEQR